MSIDNGEKDFYISPRFKGSIEMETGIALYTQLYRQK